MEILPDHVMMWIDRIGNMVFISDECDGVTMSPLYYSAAIRDCDSNNGATEASIWWM